jgi:site-specific recombinase XerD
LDDEVHLDDPTTATVMGYRTWLRSTRPPLSIATINNRIDTIQAFYRWTAAVARYPDIAASVTSLTDARMTPLAVLTKRDVQRMIDRMGDETLRDVRNRALVWLLFGGALETISLHRAQVADFAGSMGTLRHQPRGHRRPDVVTTLPREAIAAVIRYLTMRAPEPSEPLFTSTRHATSQRLSTLSMRLTVRRCLDALQPPMTGAGKPASPIGPFVPSALRVSGLCHRLGGRARITENDLVRLPREAQAVGYRSTRAARNLVKRCLDSETTSLSRDAPEAGSRP